MHSIISETFRQFPKKKKQGLIDRWPIVQSAVKVYLSVEKGPLIKFLHSSVEILEQRQRSAPNKGENKDGVSCSWRIGDGIIAKKWIRRG